MRFQLLRRERAWIMAPSQMVLLWWLMQSHTNPHLLLPLLPAPEMLLVQALLRFHPRVPKEGLQANCPPFLLLCLSPLRSRIHRLFNQQERSETVARWLQSVQQAQRVLLREQVLQWPLGEPVLERRLHQLR